MLVRCQVRVAKHLTLPLHLYTKAFRETGLSVKRFSAQTREGKHQASVPLILEKLREAVDSADTLFK